MRFAHAGRSDEENVGGLANEPARRQFKNLLAIDVGIELPIELLKGFQMPEVGGLRAPFERPFLAQGQFILQDQFQEIRMAQPVGGRFLEPDRQRLLEAGKS